MLPRSGRRCYRNLPVAIALIAAPFLARAEADERSEVRVGPVEVRAEADRRPPPEPTVAEAPTGFGSTIRLDPRAGERRDVADLLLEVPGVRVHHAPGGETLMLRGGSSDQTLVFLDGIPLNAAAGGGVDLRTIPAALLERITVLRGNEGAQWGAGALAGVALLKTRSPRDHAGGTAAVSAGSFGTFELSGAAWGGSRRASGLAALTWKRSDGDYQGLFDPTRHFDESDARLETVTNNDERGGGALLKGRVALGEGAELHGMAHGWLGERGLPGTFFHRDDHRRKERRLLTALRMEGEPDGDLQLGAGLSFRRDEVLVWSPEDRRDVGSLPWTDETGDPWQTEDAIALRLDAEAAPFDWTLLRLDGSLGGDWIESPYHGRRERQRLSAALAEEFYLGSSITLAPAIRWDRVGDDEGLSPRVGAAWRPIAPLELRANWGRSFRAPSFGELYLEQAAVKANPDLVPERGWTADVGVVLRVPRATLQAVAFYSRIEDLILYEVVSGGSKPFNVHDAAVRGGELELAWQPWSWLAIGGGYSLALTRNLRDDPRYLGKELSYRPPHRVHARVAARTDDWEAWTSFAHQSAQWINRTNTDRLPAGTTVGVGAGVRVVDAPWAIWLSGQVDNAFDELLLDRLGFPRPGRTFTVTLRAHSPEERRGTFEET